MYPGWLHVSDVSGVNAAERQRSLLVLANINMLPSYSTPELAKLVNVEEDIDNIGDLTAS